MSKDKKIDIKKITQGIIASLSERQRDVLVKRFGLLDGKRKTLEEIGQGYGITRERVRQIENDARAAFLKQEAVKKLDPFFKALESHIDSLGGLRTERQLLEEDVDLFFPKSLDKKEASAFMYFLLNMGSQFDKVAESDNFNTIWTTRTSRVKVVQKALESLVKKLKDHKDTVSKETLIEWLSSYLPEKNEVKVLGSFVSASKDIDMNVYGDHGLKHWPEIATKGVRDKAYIILKKHGKPLHFRFVVDKINEKFKSNKKAHPQTVHNELIKDNKFILVGRGTYALSEWGYKPGTVSDVLARILKDNKSPMKKEEIVEAVLKERDVKENTIMLNLQNNNNFEKMNDGRYVFKA